MNKFAWSGVAVLLAAVMAFGLLAAPAQAAAPTVLNVVIIDADDTIDQPTTDVALIRVIVDVDDGDAGVLAAQTNETIVTLTTTAGYFLESGLTTLNVHCAIDAAGVVAEADPDAGDEAGPFGISEGVFDSAAEDEGATAAVDETALDADDEEGCLGVDGNLVVPKDQPTGQIVISARTTNGIQASEILTIQNAPGTGDASAMVLVSGQPVHGAVGYTSSTAEFNPIANGTRIGVQVTDSDGLRLNGQTIQWTTDAGVFTDDTGSNDLSDIEAACDSTTNLGTTAFSTTAGTNTTAGRAYVLLCGTSGSAGDTANVKATVVGKESVTLTKAVTISAKPSSANIALSLDGSTVTATVTVDGVPAPDETNIRFQVVPNDQGAVSSACVALNNGMATTSVAVTPGQNVTVLVTAGEAPDGSDAACAVADARTYGSASLLVSGGGGGTVTPPPTGTNCGSFAAAPVFSSSKLANAVYNCGTVAQLDAALRAVGATGAWAQNAQGVFLLYVVNGGFVNDQFNAGFPSGFATVTAMTLVGS